MSLQVRIRRILAHWFFVKTVCHSTTIRIWMSMQRSIQTGQLCDGLPRVTQGDPGDIRRPSRTFRFVLVAVHSTASHLRLKAAKKLELCEVPVVFCEGWTEAQVKGFRLLANRSANWADWDIELLQLEIADLSALGVDLSLTGFDPQEIVALQTVIGSGLTDEDSVPKMPTEAVSKRGHLWRLGAHRLLCGDATVAPDVAQLLGVATPTLLVCDSPYGVNYVPAWRNRAAKAGKIAFAARREGPVPN